MRLPPFDARRMLGFQMHVQIHVIAIMKRKTSNDASR
jgi:hypothetical protein